MRPHPRNIYILAINAFNLAIRGESSEVEFQELKKLGKGNTSVVGGGEE